MENNNDSRGSQNNDGKDNNVSLNDNEKQELAIQVAKHLNIDPNVAYDALNANNWNPDHAIAAINAVSS